MALDSNLPCRTELWFLSLLRNTRGRLTFPEVLGISNMVDETMAKELDSLVQIDMLSTARSLTLSVPLSLVRLGKTTWVTMPVPQL